MTESIAERREITRTRLGSLVGRLREAEEIVSGKACVYATGSFGRREGGRHSDLDLFIVGLVEKKTGKRSLSHLDEIRLKSRLIEAAREEGFPDFTDDGEYVVHYTVQDLIRHLGTRNDDHTNTFTARMLLLLESTPLVGTEAYESVVRQVTRAYWRDYERNKDDFCPAYLVNDILRLWRTFCVNYEASTSEEPKEKKAKRQLKNYKLRHSRLLTCYSGLVYLLAAHNRDGTVQLEEAQEMVRLSPTERLNRVARWSPAAQAAVDDVLQSYDAFLQRTSGPQEELIARIIEKGRSAVLTEPRRLGDGVFGLLEALRGTSPLYRMIVV